MMQAHTTVASTRHASPPATSTVEDKSAVELKSLWMLGYVRNDSPPKTGPDGVFGSNISAWEVVGSGSKVSGSMYPEMETNTMHTEQTHSGTSDNGWTRTRPPNKGHFLDTFSIAVVVHL